MITVKTFVCNMIDENCYVVSDETREAVIIDCGAFYDDDCRAIASYIAAEQLVPRHLLCTHGHLDHCFGNAFVYHTYGLRPEISAADDYLIDNLSQQALTTFGLRAAIEDVAPDHWLSPGEQITFGSHTLTALPTPGHTPGGMTFHCPEEAVAFSGDTLFRMGIGRTDLARGNFDDLLSSLHNVLAKLPGQTVVYSGHGPTTTISDERLYSPYFR